MSKETLDDLIVAVQGMARTEVLEALGQLATSFPIDFTPDFLAQCTEERLKHILLAAKLHTRRAG